MIEVLAFANTAIIIAILIYFYFKDSRQREETGSQIEKSQDFIKEMLIGRDKVVTQNFKDFLTHIRKLEEMTLPKPVTKAMVNDIMLRTPPLIENEIEKDPETINQDNFMDVLGRIPIDRNTNVSFENEIESTPEEIIP